MARKPEAGGGRRPDLLVLSLIAVCLMDARGALAVPPIRSPLEAVARLRRGPDVGRAVRAVDEACRGRYRRSLQDAPSLVKEAERLLRRKAVEAKKGALDLHRCFSTEVFVRKLLEPALRLAHPSIVAYAAEVAARREDPAVAAPLLDRLQGAHEGCLRKGQSAAEVEVCVWLTYAPGTGLSAADTSVRTRAGELVGKLALHAPYPKVREVAVETLTQTRLKDHAETIRALIRKERSGQFSKSNDKSLLRRFEKRARALAKSGS